MKQCSKDPKIKVKFNCSGKLEIRKVGFFIGESFVDISPQKLFVLLLQFHVRLSEYLKPYEVTEGGSIMSIFVLYHRRLVFENNCD